MLPSPKVATLLAVYCALIGLASLAGGWLPIFVRLTHRGMEVAISFVAGVILGVGMLHLLPHGFYELGSLDETVQWVLFGFLLMFFVERFFHFHHHGPPAEDHHAHEHARHGHTHHGHGHAEHDHSRGGRFSWAAAAVGLTLHGIVEGIALTAAVSAESFEEHAVALAGLSTFLAIVLHKPFDSLTILTLMSATTASPRRRHVVNALYALVVPVGVVLYMLAAGQANVEGEVLLGRSLSFAAGTFLCISTSDLLPELQFHRHDRLKLSLALIAGVTLAWVLVKIESRGHDHHPHEQHESHHDEPHHDHSGHDHSDHDH